MEVEEGKEDHFAADEDRGDAEVDVVVGEGRAWFHGAGGGEDGEDEALERAETDDALDSEELGYYVEGFEVGAEALVKF